MRSTLFHTTLDGPFLFTNSRPIFYDFKVLWALMYHYRNQQRSAFHFHRLNLLMKCAKKFRQLELTYIDSLDSKLLDDLVACAQKMKESALIAGAAIQKLMKMKLYMPFALTAEASIASIYSKIDFLVKELELTKDPNKQITSAHNPITKEPKNEIKNARVEKHVRKPQNIKPVKLEKLSKLCSMRKPTEKNDEIDNIFGEML